MLDAIPAARLRQLFQLQDRTADLTFVSFAQNFEDVMLWRALGHIGTGFYIDVGAWSPEQDSVTKAFYDRGWSGINVEPNPIVYAELHAARPRDVNLELAIAEVEGTADIYVVGQATGLATLNSELASDHSVSGHGASQPLSVATRTLASLCRDHVPAGTDIHFLKIDVEGAEAAVIRGADWVRYRPWVVIVEATRPASRIETYGTWESVLVEAGYTLVYRDGLNRFYVADEHADLATAFAYPPNIFDGFVPAAQQRAETRLSAFEREIDTLRQDVQRLTNTVRRMQESLSWRLTKPARSMARTIENAFDASCRTILCTMRARWPARLWRRDATENLTPQARRIYVALKAAIARRRIG